MAAEQPQGSAEAEATLQREAQAWVVRLGSHQATQEDAQAFRLWCAQSRAHATAFAQAREVWKAMAPAALHVRRQEQRGADRRMPVAGRRALLGGAVAASAAYLAVSPPLGLWASIAEWGADYRTGTGEQREVAMADGAVLQMNTQTRINLQPGTGGGEGIELLAGEAELLTSASAVARVTVSAAGGTVSAMRARFNIRNLDGEVCVTCLSGQVEVARGERQVRLDEGRQLRYGSAGVGTAAPVDTGPVSAWRRRQLVFNEVPLADVVAEVNRYRHGRLVLTSEALGRSRVQASFSIDRLDDVAFLVRDVYGAELTQLPGGIVLLGLATA